MKKKNFFILGMAASFVLSGCGGKSVEPDAKKFNLTFHQESGDVSFVITQGVTKNSDVVAPEIQDTPPAGYTFSWPDFDVETMTSDYIVELNKNAVTYYATFVNEDEEPIKVVEFTVETAQLEDVPAVPKKDGYQGSWESYTLGPSDITISPQYQLITYVARFIANGVQLGEDLPFDIFDCDENNMLDGNLVGPQIPESYDTIEYKDPVWGKKSISDADNSNVLTFELEYVDHQYSIEFLNENGERVDLVKYTTDGTNHSPIDEPNVPSKEGYDGEWGTYVANGSQETITVSPVYDAITYYAVFKDGDTVVESVPYTIETIQSSGSIEEPNVPVHEGMDGVWSEYELAIGGIEVNAVYELHKFYIDYVDEAGEIVESVAYNVETAGYSSIVRPDVPEKAGYTGEWDDQGVTLTNSDTHMVIAPKYTANTYQVTFPDDSTAQVTFGEDYDFSAKTSYFEQLYNGNEVVAAQGKWSYPNDVVLTTKANKFGYENFEETSNIDGLLNLAKTTAGTPIVKDGVGVNGSRGLEVPNFYGDKGLYFTKQYLDLVFAKPEIKGLNFDFRADVECENFRHKTYNSDASGNTGTGAKNVTYFAGQTGTGLLTRWKTAQFTRAMYNELATNPSFDGGFVIFGTTNNDAQRKIYIDNLTPVTYDAKEHEMSTTVMFNEAREEGSASFAGNDVLIRDAYTNKQYIKIWGNNASITAFDYSTTIKTEGLSSLHFVKGATDMSFGIHQDIIDAAIATGATGMEFNVMVDHIVGPANFLWYQDGGNGRGNSTAANSDYQVINANQWSTLRVPFNHIRDTNTGYDMMFYIRGSDGNQIKNVWVDNIKPYFENIQTGTTMLESFEDTNIKRICAYKSNGELDAVYYESGKANYVRENDELPVRGQTNYRDFAFSNFWFACARKDTISQSWCVASIDDEHTTDGAFAYKLSVEKDSVMTNAFIESSIAKTKLSAGDKILIDVYTDAEGASFGGRVNGAKRDAQPLTKGQFTTIEIVRSTDNTVENSHFHRINETALKAGNYWFDNIRIVKA